MINIRKLIYWIWITVNLTLSKSFLIHRFERLRVIQNSNESNQVFTFISWSGSNISFSICSKAYLISLFFSFSRIFYQISPFKLHESKVGERCVKTCQSNKFPENKLNALEGFYLRLFNINRRNIKNKPIFQQFIKKSLSSNKVILISFL